MSLSYPCLVECLRQEQKDCIKIWSMEDVFAILPIGFGKISTLSTSNVSDECKSRRRLHNHGGLSPASQNPYPILTKIYDILYPIYDLIKNSKHYL